MELLAVGTKVTIGGDVPGEITQIRILSKGYFEYMVAWWNGHTRTDAWFQDHEVATKLFQGKNNTLNIGFKPS